jgi:hypothetical protein
MGFGASPTQKRFNLTLPLLIALEAVLVAIQIYYVVLLILRQTRVLAKLVPWQPSLC